jgi:SAM-dependent methyltransferase
MPATVTARLHNRTRRSRSIPLSLLRRGRVLDLPLYGILRLSDLAREGLDRSGSHHFADHIYRSEPSGRLVVGRWLDALLLSLPATRAFQYRYVAARNEVVRFVSERTANGKASLDILSVPCGLPRELADAAQALRHASVPLDGIRFHGLDLDSDVLHEASAFANGRGLRPFVTHRGDALDRASYPARADAITCTGLAEFLTDAELEHLYAILFDVLTPGGILITSGMQRRRFSDYLLQLAEIPTQYRTPADLERVTRRLPFAAISTYADPTGLQTILKAYR